MVLLLYGVRAILTNNFWWILKSKKSLYNRGKIPIDVIKKINPGYTQDSYTIPDTLYKIILLKGTIIKRIIKIGNINEIDILEINLFFQSHNLRFVNALINLIPSQRTLSLINL